ncbi:hypothetical protein Tco_1280047, partial [Tanacetum coccineum]
GVIPAHFDSEIISQTDRGQSSRVFIPLSDDPYGAVRQSHLVDTNIKSGPLEDLRETEIPQPLPSAPSLVPPSDDLYLIEFEASEPSDTRITSPHSITPSDSTTSLSPDHPFAQTSPASTQASYYRSTTQLVEDTEDESSDSDTKREGSNDKGSDLEDEGYGSKEEGPGSKEEEEAVPKGQQQAVPVVDKAANEPLGLGYGALRRHESMSEQQRVEETPTPRPWVHATWVDPVDGTVYTNILVDVPPALPTPVASLVTTPVATIAVGEDEFLEVGAQLELHGSILHDHTHHLDVLPPTLFEGYNRDLRELYTRSREIRDEIFSQRYRLRSLEQERAIVTFGAIWRPVLALESWAGYVNARGGRYGELDMMIKG